MFHLSTSRKSKAIRRLLLSIGVVSFPCLVLAQGSLTPPGAPAPTMKTLDQIESRISVTNMPYTITQSGSYYVTTNLFAPAGATGILINADSVTVDLNGFTLYGSGTNSGEGIYSSGSRKNIRIQNGQVANWAGAYKRGVWLDGYNNAIYQIHAVSNYEGIVGRDAVISQCAAYQNSDDGIHGWYGAIISRCSSSYNGNDGFYVGDGVIIKNCTARYNTDDGIEVSTPGCLVLENTCKNNGYLGDGAGIHSTFYDDHRIEANTVIGNDIGIDVDSAGNLIICNSASGNTTNYSIVAGNAVGAILDVTGGVTISNSNPWANFEF